MMASEAEIRSTQAELHNTLAPRLVNEIVRAPLETGASAGDVFVLLESVTVGVVLALVREGGDEAVLTHFMAGTRRRLAEARLMRAPTGGSA